MAALGEDLLVTVNKLQDLVFNTIGNDSLDLPQIVSESYTNTSSLTPRTLITSINRSWWAPNHPASPQY